MTRAPTCASACAALARGRATSDRLDSILVRSLQDRVPAVRDRAWRVIGELGRSGVLAQPGLLDALDDRESSVRERAWVAISAIILAATEEDPVVRELVRSERFIKLLIKALYEPDDAVRWAAHALLRFLATRSPHREIFQIFVKSLAALMRHPRPAVRQRACWAIGQIGPPAEAAVPGLKDAMNDEAEPVRDAASKAYDLVTGGVGGIGEKVGVSRPY